MIEIEKRIHIIQTLSGLLSSEGLTLKQTEKDRIKDVILEHVTYLQAGIVDNKNDQKK